jgi:hypothetical protein
MAPLPDVVGVLRWDIRWGDGISTFGSRVFLGAQLPGASVDALTDGCNALNTIITDDIISLIGDDFTFVGSSLTDLSSVTGATATVDVNTPCTGGGGSMSSNVSMNANAVIPDRYRGGHPLTHFPPAPAADLVNPRQWSAGTLTTWTTHLDSLLSDVNAANIEGGPDFVWTVLRGYRAGATPEEVVPYAVSSLHPRQYVGTIRRRARSLH